MNDTLLPNEIHSMLKILKDELHLRFGKNKENLLITQASLLDPRFKKYAFLDENKCKTAINHLKAKAQSLTIESDIPMHH